MYSTGICGYVKHWAYHELEFSFLSKSKLFEHPLEGRYIKNRSKVSYNESGIQARERIGTSKNDIALLFVNFCTGDTEL